MATLAEGGRVTAGVLDEELSRLRAAWDDPVTGTDDDGLLDAVLGPGRSAEIDPFDRVQLAQVIRVCRGSKNQSEAGRRLFSVSRLARKHANDADRLGKYLARFDLSWKDCAPEVPAGLL
jgi:transcriptional regulatory protein RtcR